MSTTGVSGPAEAAVSFYLPEVIAFGEAVDVDWVADDDSSEQCCEVAHTISFAFRGQ